MRSFAAAVCVVILGSAAVAQQPDVPTRFDVLHNAELYKQDTPQNTLNSVLIAISRDRYDYVIAHLLDPALVDARMATNQAYFERVAAEKVAGTAVGQLLKGADLEKRVKNVAVGLNVKHLGVQIKEKLSDEPDILPELKRLARDGQFEVSGDEAKGTLRDIKDRALYFKKSGGRWFLEIRRAAVAAKE
jgi:hypothetical protein